MKKLLASSLIKSVSEQKDAIRRGLALLLLPMLMCLVLFLGVRRVAAAQMSDRANLTLENFKTQSYLMLREMQLVLDSLSENREFIRTLSGTETGIATSAALDEMIEAAGRSSYVNHIFVACERQDRVYSDNGYYRFSSLSSLVNFESVREVGCGVDSDWRQASGTAFSPYIVSELTDRSGAPLATVVVTLQPTEFMTIFGRLDVDVCCIFDPESDFYLSSLIRPLDKTPVDWSSAREVSRLVGTDVICFYSQSGGYTYMVGMSRAQYSQPLNLILAVFALYTAAVLAYLGWYLYRDARRRQNQISMLIDALPQHYKDSGASPNVIGSVRQALLDFKSQNQDLTMLTRGRRLHALLYGHSSPESEKNLRDAGLLPLFRHYCVVFFVIRDYASTELSTASPIDALKIISVILKSSLSGFSGGELDAQCCLDDKGVILLFGDDNETHFAERTYQACCASQQMLSSQYGIRSQVLASRMFTDIAEMHSAFQETQDLYCFARTVNSDVPFLSNEELQENSAVLLDGGFIRQEQILVNALLSEKYAIIPALVDSIIDEQIAPLQKNYPLAESRLLSLSSILSESLLIAGKTRQGAFDEQAARFQRVSSLSELSALTHEIFGSMQEQLRCSTKPSREGRAALYRSARRGPESERQLDLRGHRRQPAALDAAFPQSLRHRHRRVYERPPDRARKAVPARDPALHHPDRRARRLQQHRHADQKFPQAGGRHPRGIPQAVKKTAKRRSFFRHPRL